MGLKLERTQMVIMKVVSWKFEGEALMSQQSYEEST